jgi:hypothetical protein
MTQKPLLTPPLSVVTAHSTIPQKGCNSARRAKPKSRIKMTKDTISIWPLYIGQQNPTILIMTEATR